MLSEATMQYIIAESESFDFSNLQAGLTQTLELARSIDISQVIDGGLNVRVHSLSTIGTTGSQSIKVVAYPVWVDERTGTVFSSDTAIASADIIARSPAPVAGVLLSDAFDFSVQRPAAIRVVLEAKQFSPAAALFATLSVAVVLVTPG